MLKGFKKNQKPYPHQKNCPCFRCDISARKKRGERLIKSCLVCGHQFSIILSKRDRKYCGKDCKYKDLSKRYIGCTWGIKKGNTPWNKGKKGEYHLWPNGRVISKEQRIKIAMARKGKKWTIMQRIKANPLRGRDHYNWKGGITPINEKIRKSFEYRSWRESVFKRDNYTCQKCGIRSGSGKKVTLNADHIRPFSLCPELRLEVSNGRTLCKNCHRQTDTYGGRIVYNNFNFI